MLSSYLLWWWIHVFSPFPFKFTLYCCVLPYFIVVFCLIDFIVYTVTAVGVIFSHSFFTEKSSKTSNGPFWTSRFRHFVESLHMQDICKVVSCKRKNGLLFWINKVFSVEIIYMWKWITFTKCLQFVCSVQGAKEINVL